MRRIVFGTLWLSLFLLGGAGVTGLGSYCLHYPLSHALKLARAAAECGVDLYLILLCFGRLAGARQRRGAAASFGVWQALQGLLGFGAMMIAGALAVYNLLFVQALLLFAIQSSHYVDFQAHGAAVAAVLAGEISAALWVAWFLRQLGVVRLADGEASGIAWRAAPRRAYASAVFAALVIIFVVSLLFYLIPPDLNALKNLPDAKLFEGGGWLVLPLLVLFILFGPVLEELVFRGIAFAGLAARLGPRWAAIITTLLFMAMHAPEKIHYPAGFLDVGLMAAAACWLRLRYRSIRPGMLLHILYNGGLMLAAGISAGD